MVLMSTPSWTSLEFDSLPLSSHFFPKTRVILDREATARVAVTGAALQYALSKRILIDLEHVGPDVFLSRQNGFAT